MKGLARLGDRLGNKGKEKEERLKEHEEKVKFKTQSAIIGVSTIKGGKEEFGKEVGKNPVHVRTVRNKWEKKGIVVS